MANDQPSQNPARRVVKLQEARAYKCPQGHEGGNVAAFVLAPDNETVLGRFPRVEEANECAAFPALLRSLKRWRQFAENNNYTDSDFHSGDGTGWITEMNEAIAKAEACNA